MDRVIIISHAVFENCMPLIITIVATIIATSSFKMMCKIMRGDLDFPTIPKISKPKFFPTKRKKEEKKNFDLPEKQKDFIQLN